MAILFVLIAIVLIIVVTTFNSKLLLPPIKLSTWIHSILQYISPTKPKKSSTIHHAQNNKKYDPLSSFDVQVEHVDLKDIFSMFDTDGDGFITRNELEHSLKRLGLVVDAGEVIGMMERVDVNGDGLIDLHEFHQLYVALVGATSASANANATSNEGDDNYVLNLKEAFGVFDDNKDGLISVEELGLVLKSLGLNQGANLEYCKEMIEKVDVDGDGKVNFEEFKKMMLVK